MQHSTAIRIAASALLLGIAADQLLTYGPWGTNALIWTVLFAGSAALLKRVPLLPAIAALLAAAGLVWRTNEQLMVIDIGLLLFFLSLLALGARGVRVPTLTLTRLVTAEVTTGLQTIAGVPRLVFSDLEWSRVPRGGAMRGTGVIVRGVLFALPPLLIFGALLASADSAFARLLGNVFNLDLTSAVQHVLVTLIVGAICAGFLRSLALGGAAPEVSVPSFIRLPIAEATIALALIDVLFATFVGVQIRYLFGDAGTLNASEYARRGFFELVAVVALVVPMLLAVEWLVDKSDARRLLVFRIVAGVQVALVLVIAASAWRRMQLYRDEFGLTEQRVLTTAFMIWLAAVLLWLALAVLTGHRDRFLAGAMIAGIAAVAALHAINPDVLIVETNLARDAAGRRAFDAAYAATLSDDAAPVILANADRFDAKSLQRFLERERTIGWRTWNVSRARAIDAVRAYESKATPPIGRP